MSFFKKVEEASEKILDKVGSFLFITMLLATFLNIFSYWFTKKRYAEFDEIVLAVFLWVVFIPTGTLYRTGEHIGVSFLVEKMRPKAKCIIKFLDDLVVIVTSVFVIYFTWKLFRRSFTKYTQVLKIPYAYIDLGVLFGYVSLIFTAIAKCIVHFGEMLSVFKKGEELDVVS